MAAVAGLRGTGDWGTDERPKNFREMILWRNPNGSAPLTALTAKMSKESVDDPEFAWWEEEQKPIRITVNYSTGYTSSDNTIVVTGDEATLLVAGDLLLIEAAAETTTYADEIAEVSSVTNATTVVIKRAAVNTTNAALVQGQAMTKIGNAFAEGTGAPAAASNNPTKLYNYTQIFKMTYDHTNTARATYARTGNIKDNDKKRKMFDLSTTMELAFLFGKRYETTGANGKPIRYTMGLLQALATYGSSSVDIATAMVGANGILDLFDVMYGVFDYNGNSGAGDERICFVGNNALNAINKACLANGTIQFTDVVKQWGMNLTKLVAPQGTFYLKSHPLMNVHARYRSSMFIIDPSNIKYRPLQGRDVNFKDNVQANDEDRTKGLWLGEVGLEFHHLKTMKYLGGISWAAS